MIARSRQSRGFTLLELVLVMVIIAIGLTIAAPKLRGWSRGRQIRDAADQFISMTRHARSQAASTGKIHRVTVDPQAGTYQLSRQEGEAFVTEATDLGAVQRLPEGAQLQFNGQTANTIDFFPGGRTQPTQIRLTSANGESIDIDCPAPAEEFAINTGVAR